MRQGRAQPMISCTRRLQRQLSGKATRIARNQFSAPRPRPVVGGSPFGDAAALFRPRRTVRGTRYLQLLFELSGS